MNEPNDSTRSQQPDPGTRTNPTHVTPTDEQARLAAELGGVSVPGFEIEGTLGRGAFGVVYRARQTGLNRAVALKMLIAGPFAGAAARARFLIEAEAVAALEHPHIVRVFQVGEHAEHPFLAMEFVPGGTLADRVRAGGPLPAADAARVVAKLAEAVAHAHSRGVVHRDIKPHNVLLTPDGEPRLTDFGLAKVGRSDMTVTGQVLGTPAYMAPEQAAGKVREVGTHSDVYALGAVLYDVLTGRPPFLGDSHAVTLQKVLTEEPERPRKLNAAVPRDLETICLKCLEKEPGKRYATAQALADDLSRHLRNEPIAARPAGALERGYKWVRRNKVVSGAVVAVFLALLTGAGVSLAFALHAHEQQKKAEDAARREEDEKREAITARNELKGKNDELNRALVRALLAPITTQDRYSALTAQERTTFRQLAGRRGGPLGVVFLAEAITEEQTTQQVECRAEFAIHAAVGLDPAARAEADRLFLRALRDPGASPDRRTALALVWARGRCAGPESALAAATHLLDAFARTTDSDIQFEYAVAVSAAIGHTDPGTADQLSVRATEFVLTALKNARGRQLQLALIECLCALTKGRDDAAVDVLTRALNETSDAEGVARLTGSLGSIAVRLPAERADAVQTGAVQSLVAGLNRENSADGRAALGAALERVLGLMRPATATTVVAAELDKKTKSGTQKAVAATLGRVAARMKPEDAKSTCAAAVPPLTAALKRANTRDGRRELSAALAALVNHLEPADAKAAALAAAVALAKDYTPNDNQPFSFKLELELEAVGVVAMIAPHLDADRAARLSESVVAPLVHRFPSQTADWSPEQLRAAAQLFGLTKRMKASRVTGMINQWPIWRQYRSPEDEQRLSEINQRLEQKELLPRDREQFLAEKRYYERKPLLEDYSVVGAAPPNQPQRPEALPDLLRNLVAETRPSVLRDLALQIRAAAAAEPVRMASNTVRAAAAGRLLDQSDTLDRGYSWVRRPIAEGLAALTRDPLPPQDLVELLKHPFCVVEARRAVLDALELTYKRSFKDQWEFVEYAQKHQSQLDLLTPPKRPEPKP